MKVAYIEIRGKPPVSGVISTYIKDASSLKIEPGIVVLVEGGGRGRRARLRVNAGFVSKRTSSFVSSLVCSSENAVLLLIIVKLISLYSIHHVRC
jgi:hypothetical protein